LSGKGTSTMGERGFREPLISLNNNIYWFAAKDICPLAPRKNTEQKNTKEHCVKRARRGLRRKEPLNEVTKKDARKERPEKKDRALY